MTLQTPDALRRLRRRARLFAHGCRLTGVAIPLLVAGAWLAGTVDPLLAAQYGLRDLASVGVPARLVAAGLMLLPPLALARALFAAARCFDGFARDDWFGEDQPAALSGAGRWLVASGVLGLVVPTLIGLVLTFGAPPGARVLAITLSSASVTSLLFGGLLWALGHLWAVARDLAAENARFV